MIVNPLLLEFNIHPQAAAATSTLMVLFSSSSAALSFGFGHQLNLHFALIFGLCCMGASLVGVLLVQRVVSRSGKVRGPSKLPLFGGWFTSVAGVTLCRCLCCVTARLIEVGAHAARVILALLSMLPGCWRLQLLHGEDIRRAGAHGSDADCMLASLQASIIVFLLALVIATGVCLTAAFGGRYAIQDLVRHSNIAFSSLCASSASS